MFLTKNDFSGYATVVPNAGLTSPLTLMGTLTQSNAEVFSLGHPQTDVKAGVAPGLW